MGILGVALPPGPIQGPAVVVGHVIRDEDDIRPVALQEAGERVMVGPRGLHGADDLRDPGLLLAPLQVRPEAFEARLGVGDRQGLVHELRVGEADLRHVLGLRDVDAHEEPIPIRP